MFLLLLLGSRGRRGSGALTIGTPRRRRKAAPVPQGTPSEEEEDDEAEESSDSEEGDPSYGYDEMGPSQLHDAPSPTQGSPQPKRQARARDHAYVLAANKLDTQPGRPR